MTSQMKSLIPTIEARVDSFVDRNLKIIRKRHKIKDVLEMNHEFSLGGHGKWDVRMMFVKMSSKDFIVMWGAYLKYYIKYAKDPSNIGAGYYVIIKSQSLKTFQTSFQFYEITPHCINRMKERYPGMKSESLDKIKEKILSELGGASRETDNSGHIAKDPDLYEMTLYTEEGQFFGAVSKEFNFMCLTTFVSNELLTREQHAYALAMRNHSGTNYSREEIREEAEKLIKKMAKAGADVHHLDSIKKEVIQDRTITEMLSTMQQSIAEHASKNKIARILGLKK